MLSLKTDLTENRDFGYDDTHLELNSDSFIKLKEIIDDEIMTSDEHELIFRWESVFGKTIHTNEKSKIFKRLCMLMDEEYSDGICFYCGKSLKSPWRGKNGVCIECALKLKHTCNIFPWRRYRRPIIRRIGDVGQGDLFELR